MRPHFPLRTHLVFLVLGTLVPALVLAGFLLRRVIRDSRDVLDRRLLDAARTQASDVDAELSGTIRALEALSQSRRLLAGDLAEFGAEAKGLLTLQPTWSAVTLSSPDGRYAIDTRRPERRGARELPAAAFDRVVSTKTPVIGTIRSEKSEDGAFSFPVHVPVVADGSLRYVLTAIITPERFARAMLAQTVRPSDEWVRTIADAAGTIVVRTRDPERFVGRPGTPTFIEHASVDQESVYRDMSLEGQPVYVAYTHAPMSGWVAGVAIPSALLEGTPRSVLALGSLGMMLLIVGAGGAFEISRRLSRDIAGAAGAAEALARGDRPRMMPSPISEVRQLSDALKRSASLIEAHGRERDEQVKRADAARVLAETADRAKDDFLATLGHELRNPLAPALTALHLMRARGETAGLREREIIERQVRHLARLVDDLLDVSRAQSGRIELRRHPFDIIHAVETAVEISGPLISDRGHRLVIDVPAGLIVDGDETRLAQVFANLLNNAAKYSDGPGAITLTAFSEPDAVIVRCEDDGIGIAEDLLPHIFELFAQGRQTLDRGHGGLGLGLAVVKTLVELHGGTVAAESGGIGRGSVFTVKLPLAKAGADADTSALPAPFDYAGKGRRVLVVDDNHDAAEMLAEMLRMGGFEVQTAFDAFTALRMVKESDTPPSIAILDIGLPRMDGLELARRLRQMESVRGIRLVAVTGYGQQGDVQASIAAGFDRHLVKPVAIDDLFDAVSETAS